MGTDFRNVNQKAVRELKPYKGFTIERVKRDGRNYYLAYNDDTVIDDYSLYGLKKAINWTVGVGRLV